MNRRHELPLVQPPQRPDAACRVDLVCRVQERDGEVMVLSTPMSDAEIAENKRAAAAFGREFDAVVPRNLWDAMVAWWIAEDAASPTPAEPPL